MHRCLLTGASGQTQQETVGLEGHEVKDTLIRREWNREDGFGTRSEAFALSLNLERWIHGPLPISAQGPGNKTAGGSIYRGCC